jgi:hypothetical protein
MSMLIQSSTSEPMAPCAPPPPRPDPRPAPRRRLAPDLALAAATLQRSALPWGHPSAVELRRLFREEQ